MAATRLSGSGVVKAAGDALKSPSPACGRGVKGDGESQEKPLEVYAPSPPNPLPRGRDRGEKVANFPSTEQILAWLDDVPDPEIPVLSVTDLGIVRGAEWAGDTLEVTVTPTYSGCPATAVIALSIEEALRRKGVTRARIKTQLSPPWTTDWMREEAREKLRAYGIAPPEGAACAGMVARNAPKACPRCGSSRVEEVSRFGSTPCKAAWRCAECLEPFDYFKRF